MLNAIRIYETGGPEVMRWKPDDPGQPTAGEALVRHEAVGVNFIDVYHRTGIYPLPALPAVLGMEGAGIVEAIGEGVSEVTVGDRVAYAGMPPGADQLISERRLRDWLKLLDMRIQSSLRYFFRWPLPRRKVNPSPKWELRGQALWPELAACYMLTAQKRVSTLTPVKPLWRSKPKVVTGLAEPTARVSRIRFDKKSV